MSMRHNKKRNTALLYEFLMRHISKSLLENRKDDAKKGVLLVKKYFFKDTPLNKDFSLFKAVMENTFKSKESAQKVVTELCAAAGRMDLKELDEHKSKLIREINHTFNSPDFYDYKVPNYTVLASIQTLINETRAKNKSLTFVDKAKLEDTVIDFLVKENKNPAVEQLKINPKYSNAVYKFVIKRFNEKYAKSLNEDQKKLLSKYAIYLISENKSVLKSALDKEVETLKSKLRSVREVTVNSDPDLTKKVNECYKKLVSTNFDEISEQNVMQVLQYMQLVGEVYS